eukprot:CAMPEP_0176428020 /NCGR_PEP_ID=MMETSP0127-20121128/12915_1 /TAXON_ID=938130 /ORGANISM="Platyophrya macrostoma, Strain WH" /LENGTH=455 /DNA_ID=CAMNT_0017809651 /DNA_START=23 /DNA_END=1390 /DNA_ORIENTATION=-
MEDVPLKVQEAIFNQLLDKLENKVCADCPNKSPTWASIDFGVFICLRCSGAHRRLSPVVTRVRSAKIDAWKMEHIEMMAAVGNKIANEYWEYNVPSYFKKPDLSTSLEDVFEMVKTKYVKASFAPKDRMNPVKEFLEAKKDGQTTAGSFSQAKMEQISNGKPITTTVTQTTQPTNVIKPVEKKPQNAQNLLDFDDDGFSEFKSVPEKKTQTIDIPEVKFKSNNGMPQKSNTVDLWDGFDSKPTEPTTIQKTKSTDPFSFENQTQQPGTMPPFNQKSNSVPDSSKLYDLYKTGGNQDQNAFKPTNGVNYSGGQSNYAFLDMMGGGQNQQNRFPQQQQQQGGYGYQMGMGMQNNQGGGFQNNQTGFSQPNTFNNGFGGMGGGNNNGFSMNSNGFNSFGGGSNGFNSFNSNQTQQQQPFSFNQPKPTTTTSTTSFSFNTSAPQNMNQPTTVNTGFSFL